MAASNVEKRVASLRNEWLEVVRGLGIENLSPAEERARVDRLESALGQVVMFAMQLRLAEELHCPDEWRRFVQVAGPEDDPSDG